jgi:hypothetical protein
VAKAIFDKWFCRFGIPLDLVTEKVNFLAKVLNDLFKGLAQTTLPHLHTTRYATAKQK